jgi:hypothetical protein
MYTVHVEVSLETGVRGCLSIEKRTKADRSMRIERRQWLGAGEPRNAGARRVYQRHGTGIDAPSERTA